MRQKFLGRGLGQSQGNPSGEVFVCAHMARNDPFLPLKAWKSDKARPAQVRAELRLRLVTNASLQPEQVATRQSLTRTEVATTR